MGKEAIIAMIISYSKLFGVDPDVAVSVATIESHMKPSATSEKGAIGIFQLMPRFYPKYTIKQLRDPKVNIRLGVKLLAEYEKICPHYEDKTWVVCYFMGPTGAERIKHPKKFFYYKRVMAELPSEKEIN